MSVPVAVSETGVQSPPAKRRYYELDWLRVLATFSIFLYHCSRFFDYADWEVKNNQLSLTITVFAGIFHIWNMPMMFLISGSSSYFMLRSRTVPRFLNDRFRRLLVPMIFGVLALVPPQVYINQISHGEYSGSFLQFFPEFYLNLFRNIAKPGTFTWAFQHLWYLPVLLGLSLIALPLFVLIRREDVRARLVEKLAFLKKPGTIFLLGIPLVLVEVFLNPANLGTRMFAGWTVPTFFILMLYGFMLVPVIGLEAMAKSRWIGLVGSVVLSAILLLLWWLYPIPFYDYASLEYVIWKTLHILTVWFWLVTFVGFGHVYLNFTNAVLRYCANMVLPFYILHQTVIVVLGYEIADWDIAPLVKYPILLVVCFLITIALYEFVVRRVPALRFLFGLKPDAEPAAKPAPVLQSILPDHYDRAEETTASAS